MLGGVDIIVFTGGVGENQTVTRATVCRQLEFMGVKIDEELNSTIHGKEADLSAPESKVKVVVIPTDEEYMIAYTSNSLKPLIIKTTVKKLWLFIESQFFYSLYFHQ